jgi:Fe2+ transport system protein FeoA
MTLADLKLKEEATIVAITADGAIKDRLIALGFMVGSKVKVLRKSAGGQTFVAQLGANSIALRKEEAKTISVL